MHSFWVDFDGHASASVDAIDSTEARHLAKKITGCNIVKCSPLPYYPATPRLNYLIPGPAYCTQPIDCSAMHACKRQGQCDS